MRGLSARPGAERVIFMGICSAEAHARAPAKRRVRMLRMWEMIECSAFSCFIGGGQARTESGVSLRFRVAGQAKGHTGSLARHRASRRLRRCSHRAPPPPPPPLLPPPPAHGAHQAGRPHRRRRRRDRPSMAHDRRPRSSAAAAAAGLTAWHGFGRVLRAAQDAAVRHTGFELQTSRPQAGLLLTRVSLTLPGATCACN